MGLRLRGDRQQRRLCVVSYSVPASPLLACARRDVDLARDVGEVIVKVVAQPIGEGLRVFADTALDLIERKSLNNPQSFTYWFAPLL